MSLLTSFPSRGRKQCAIFGAQHLALFILMKQVVANLNSTQTAMSSSCDKKNKRFSFANVFTKVVRKDKNFVQLFFINK